MNIFLRIYLLFFPIFFSIGNNAIFHGIEANESNIQIPTYKCKPLHVLALYKHIRTYWLYWWREHQCSQQTDSLRQWSMVVVYVHQELGKKTQTKHV